MTTTIEVNEYQDIKSIRKELERIVGRYIRYNGDGKISLKVQVYDCTENDEQTYDVEINYFINGGYEEGFVNQTFYGRFEGDEDAEKLAVKRAKAVHKLVRQWFQYDDVEIIEGVEVYHV